MQNHRRNFLKTIAALGGSLYFSPVLAGNNQPPHQLKIACQQYPWFTFLQREGKSWQADVPQAMQQLAATGIQGFEPSFDNVDTIAEIEPLLEKHQLQTHSLYVNSVLHDEAQVETSIANVMQIARAAKPLGVKIIVTNPSPIRWGGDEDKTDDQLQLQARALNRLGEKLRSVGMTLAYHNHDAEMRNSAREFHHMMLGTDPKNVRLCLDAHWIYRGAGNSQVALFDIVRLYRDRIAELHLRQSQDGIWTESFGDGDIDYTRLAQYLLDHHQKPHLVLEQAVETASPHTLDPVTAHRQSLAYAQEVFAAWL